ncbi:unnamed protein product [Effrenium voratum]|uniref:Uncharacterized protein n=1 Tax=Effrenium voratum TaxID=2562239 RepID=A0AA36IHU2_9DINO|nr:unnamed protein product [Effrenium voratum]
MASLLESEAALRARAAEHGLTSDEINGLISQGLTTLSRVAFAVTTPGVNPDDGALRRLLNAAEPDRVNLGSLACVRRLVFEAQTMAIHQVRSNLENTEGSQKPELVPAERASRIREQARRLNGYNDCVMYPAPNKFTTRSSEVARDKPPKDLVVDAKMNLKVTSGQRDDRSGPKLEHPWSLDARGEITCDPPKQANVGAFPANLAKDRAETMRRRLADSARKAVWYSSKKGGDEDTVRAVYDASREELRACLTRRFGVSQNSVGEDGRPVKKALSVLIDLGECHLCSLALENTPQRKQALMSSITDLLDKGKVLVRLNLDGFWFFCACDAAGLQANPMMLMLHLGSSSQIRKALAYTCRNTQGV